MSNLFTVSVKTTVLSSLLLSYQWAFVIPSSTAFLPRLEARQKQSPSPGHHPLLTSPAAQSCILQNQQQQGSTTFIGRIPGAPYVVIIPNSQTNTLAIVRQCIPDAFQTNSRLGSYVQAGAFPNRSQAEDLVRYLRILDLDARVIYRP